MHFGPPELGHLRILAAVRFHAIEPVKSDPEGIAVTQVEPLPTLG